MTTLDDLLQRLEGVKKSGVGFVARCPAHEDREPSLSIREGEKGIVLHCHAGCPTEAVCAAIGLTLADLYVPNGDGKRQIVAEYPYTDEHGELLFQAVRFYPKGFAQRRPVNGEWTWKLGDVRRVLYRLPKIIETARAGGTIYVVEGEKDVHAIERAGAVATCNPMGAGKWRDEYSEHLRGATVIIVADNDDPGRAHARAVKASLAACSVSSCVVAPAKGKDAADHLAAGKGLDDFVPVDDEAGAEPSKSACFIDWSTFWDREHSAAEWVYPDILARGRAHVIYAEHRAGKSLFMLHMAAKVATGPEPVVVLYLDYEMTEADLFDRLADMGYGPGDDLSRLRYALLPAIPPLDTKDGAEALKAMLDDVEAQWPDHHFVVVLDTMSRAVEGEENSADTVRAFYNHTGIELKRRGITWVRLDHAGKDTSRKQRGSSGKGDDVDVVWKLSQVLDVVQLDCELTRMPWVPKDVRFRLRDELPLTYEPAPVAFPEGTADVARDLDRLGVPVGASVRQAAQALRDAGERHAQSLVAAAVKSRRSSLVTPCVTPRNASAESSVTPPVTEPEHG